MCGIAGVLSPQALSGATAMLDTFSSTLRHRGPDDHGYLAWCGDTFSTGRRATELAGSRLVLVHRRLSIVDLSERGWQPMVDRSGRYAMVFNGEIYNYPELRRQLEADGVCFGSDTDTEVLLQLLIRGGVAALRRAVGMFAFAFVDRAERKLWLARDPFGIKPLFIADHGGRFAFASEIRPLLEFNLAPRTVHPPALFDYLRHGVTDRLEDTAVEGIRQLRPGHTLEVALDSATAGKPARYWHPAVDQVSLSVDAAAERLRELFRNSVQLHLRADVPVAATLSGGIDSSAIVCAVREQRRSDDVAVFSYIADDPVLSEERYVDIAAAAAAVHPHKIHVQPDQLAAELDALIVTQEQPFTTTSIWAQSRVFQRVRDEGFKVVLDGQGADELFAGYPVFRAARLQTLIRRGHWPAALRLLRAIPGSRLTTLLQAAGALLPPQLQSVARRGVGRPMMPQWLNAAWFERHRAVLPAESDRPAARTDLLEQLYDATVATSLPMLLRYADRNAMAVSLENRVPFLTTALAEFALSLPDDMLIAPDGTTKALLRRAMRGIVPDPILDRRDKLGFVTPETRWFAHSAALRAGLSAVVARPLPACFAPELGAELQAVADGRRPYSAAVWRCWNVLRWAELLRLEFPS
jgi:asparagine synthase (glutamine-hydrolysing)